MTSGGVGMKADLGWKGRLQCVFCRQLAQSTIALVSLITIPENSWFSRWTFALMKCIR